jgi:nucleotide-binding universal stress UspA family protein
VINKILLGVDLGLYTPHLLQHAASLSNQYHASMVVVHAVEPLGNLGHALLQTYLKPEMRKEITTTGMNSLVQQIREQVIDMVTDEYMTGEMELPRVEDVIVREGAPEEVIIAVAQEMNTDVIILGSASPETSHQHVGSVSQKVLANSKWPVYLIPHAQAIWNQPSADGPEIRI